MRHVYRVSIDSNCAILTDRRNTNMRRYDEKQTNNRTTMTNITHNGRIVHTVNSVEAAYVWIATINQMQRFMGTTIRKYCVIAT